jgi:hypothetical protein
MWGEVLRHVTYALAGLVLVALTGCTSNPLDSSPAPSGGSTFRDRMNNLFFGSPGSEAQAQALASAADPLQDCPAADIRSGASTLPFNASRDAATPNTLRYQATIARLARECAVRGSSMTIKVGVQGRVVVGPAGGPGQIEVPLRYALVQEGPEPKTILTKFYKFPVSIAEGQNNVPFLHVEEDITFTVPSRAALDNYIVYVGFDPAAAKEPPAKKPPAKTAAPKLRGSR